MSEFICHEDDHGGMHLNIPCEMVVRCKDCKHSSVSFDETRTMCRYWSMNDYDDSESSHGYTLYPVVSPEGFCAWGKRRKEVDA